MWAMIGPKDPRPDYDQDIPVDNALWSTCALLLAVVPDFAPPWPPPWEVVPSSAYGTLCSGGFLLTRTFAVSTDAALPGWGRGPQTPEDRRMRVFS